MTRPTRAERASALAAALEGARHRAPIRRWLQHRLAGELSLLGRFEDAVAVLDPADADCSSIRNLVGGLVGIGTSAPSRDAHHLEVAAWYGRRGDHDRAYEALAEAEAADAWNPTIIRTLAVLALIRAHRSLPTVDADAWRDFIAHVSVFLANPRWVGAFVLERLKVYGSDEPYDGFVDGTRQGAEQHAERVISNAIADAKGRGDEEAAAALSELHVELIRELMAARAVWDAEAAQVSSGAGKTRVGFGPLFAERVAGLEELRSYFVNSASEERRPPPDERLRALVRRFGIDLPDEGVAEDTDLRRWFSELSLANAHRAAGNWEAARRAALAVFVRYMPPADADRAEIERLNLGFAGLPDPAEALRQDAARLCSDVGVSALKASLSADVEVEQVSEMLRAAIGESVALGVESETRERLSRLLIGKDEQLAQRDSLAADSLATRLLKTALDTGIPGLEATYHRSLARYGYRLGNSGRHQDAADQYQAAWRAQPHDTQAGASWTFSLLMCAQEARDAGLTAEADRLLDRAREAVKSIKRSARDDEEVKNLERALQVVGWGVPLSEVVEIRSSPPPGLPEAPAAATGALERARELVAGRRFEEAAALLDGLGEHATHPRVLVQRAAVAVALAATAGPRHDAGAVGLEAYEALRRSLATSVSRHPNEPELCIANAELELHKPLWKADDPVSKLLAKGLRLRLKGRYAQAAELLKTVYALSPRRDSTLCLVLAQCLARAVSDGVDEGEDHLMTSRKLVKIAARRSPTHPLIAGVRSDIAWADGSPGGSE